MKLDLSARFLILALLCGSYVLNTPEEELEYDGVNTLQISNVNDLISFYQYADDRIPLISGHRGGRGKGYPENSMGAFENTLSYTPAAFEIDPRLTKDSVIVLLHDDTLERTSNRIEKVSDYTWEKLQNFRLRGPEGGIISYRIPTLEKAIRWARGGTILTLGKKGVPMGRTTQLTTDMQAEPYVMITVHDGASVRFFYGKNPNLIFKAFVRTKETVRDHEDNGIPWNHIMAYVRPKITPGVREVIDMLHERNVMYVISTVPSDDKLPTPESRTEACCMIIRQGMDIIESDRPIEVVEAISSLTPVSSSEGGFFSTL